MLTLIKEGKQMKRFIKLLSFFATMVGIFYIAIIVISYFFPTLKELEDYDEEDLDDFNESFFDYEDLE